MIVTIRLGGNCSQPQWRDPFLEVVRKNPGCCDEVWLGSHFAFPPMEKHESLVAALKETIGIFKAEGIQVSTQITNTLGHGQCAEVADCSAYNYEGSPAGHMVGSDGIRAGYCFCYNDPHVRAYSQKVTETYASLKPHTMWIDDDLRPENHESTYVCFCDSCMARFNQLHKSSLSREKLVRLLNDDVQWREKWVNFIRAGLADFTRHLAEAVMRVSPDSLMAYQYPHVSNYAGADNKFFFQAMKDASGRPPASRAGHSYYEDSNPLILLEKAYRILYCNRMLPDFVIDRRPEIENIPHVPFCKTIFGTMTESALYLAMGCTGLTYSIAGGAEKPEDYRDRILQGISARRPYWDRLAKASETTRYGGVAVAVSENMHLYPNKEGEPDFDWTKHRWLESVFPAQYGMPLGFDDNAARVLLLNKKVAASLPDETIRKCMTRPAIVEAAVVDHLMQRGFDFGITLKPIQETTVTERLTNHPINAGNEGHTWRHTFETPPMWELSSDKAEPLGTYITTVPSGKKYGIASAIVDIGNGVKWVVIGQGLTDVIVSSVRRNQIINAADHICGYSLPALLITADKLMNIPRVDVEGRLVSVSVLHHGIGKTLDDIRLRIRRPVGKRFEYINNSHPTVVLPLTPERDGDDFIVTIPALDGWDIGTVFCEKN